MGLNDELFSADVQSNVKDSLGDRKKYIFNLFYLSHDTFTVHFLFMSSLIFGKQTAAMSHKVVRVQPESTFKEAGQWSTGLCECYKDIGDCK